MTSDAAPAGTAGGWAARGADIGRVRLVPAEPWSSGVRPVAHEPRTSGVRQVPDARRALCLVLAGIWLLDALLQLQAFMFSPGFARMLASSAAGNPGFVAAPIGSTARIIAAHPIAANSAFAAVQLLLGLGIAWRPAVRIALASSVAWSVAVWWLGEGLGGILNGSASPVNGAPGPAIIYALLAILLWPARAETEAAFPAGRWTGVPVARALWVALWGGLAGLALLPGTHATGALGRAVSGLAAGQPGWLAATDEHLAGYLRQRGPAAAIALAALLAIVALGIFLPQPGVQVILVLALLAAMAIWLAQGLGGILSGSGTDPSSGPLLALLALAYWPWRTRRSPEPGAAA